MYHAVHALLQPLLRPQSHHDGGIRERGACPNLVSLAFWLPSLPPPKPSPSLPPLAFPAQLLAHIRPRLQANVDKPLVCFFACRDIAPDEELTFNYRGADDDGPQDGPATVHSDEVYAKCLCGAANCTGTFFRVHRGNVMAADDLAGTMFNSR